jgi:glutathione synthase/RimK-type ligase-like ATP-grasp enzyme
MKEYDFALNWSVKTREHFINALKEASEKKDLSFLWICDDNVKDVIKRLEKGELKINFLLDTEATYNKEKDLYARVCYAVKDTGGAIVNDPDRARLAVDKSVMHYELINAGIHTPYSVIVRNWEPGSFRLSDEEKKKLGNPFVIKPACGYGQQGVVRDAHGSIREIARARNFDHGDNFLLQERIDPIELGGKRAWFRVFHIFDTIIPCWWDDRTSWYNHLTEEEFRDYRLAPLAKIVSRIADIAPLLWFSTEIAVDRKSGRLRFVAIDYVNDQCDMTAQSQDKSGVPDSIVTFTAKCIVEAAYHLLNKKQGDRDYIVWFRHGKRIHLKGLGDTPGPLTATPEEGE